MTENEVLESALEKVKAQKINFGFMERFNVDENWEVMKALEEIQQYRAIGTIEELQTLKEKAEPKKPNYEGDGYYNGELVLDTWICPNCGKSYEVDYDNYDYCPNCGQNIDHSGLTEDD